MFYMQIWVKKSYMCRFSFFGQSIAEKSFVEAVNKDGKDIKDVMRPRRISALCRYYFMHLT